MSKVSPILACEVREGMVLTDSAGQHRRFVVDVDHVSNAHGRVIIRTAIRPNARPTGSTVAKPDSDLHILVGGK